MKKIVIILLLSSTLPAFGYHDANASPSASNEHHNEHHRVESLESRHHSPTQNSANTTATASASKTQDPEEDCRFNLLENPVELGSLHTVEEYFYPVKKEWFADEKTLQKHAKDICDALMKGKPPQICAYADIEKANDKGVFEKLGTIQCVAL